MKIAAEISFEEIENENGDLVDGCRATCSRCAHVTESFGESCGSVRRCLALLREECPLEEKNFYVEDD